MKYIETDIPGVVILEPRVFEDARGYFYESYSKREFDEAIRPVDFVQDNQSMSSRGVIRGLHFQSPPFSQSKLVRCLCGSVVDVAVDIRKGSPTYGHHVAVVLSDENRRMLFVPRGFAHGFSVLTDIAVFQYKCDNYYAPQSEGGISVGDTSLCIDWRIKPEEALMSEKDLCHPMFDEFDSPFRYDVDLY